MRFDFVTRAALLMTVDRLRRRFAHFKLGAHLLQARRKRFNLLLLVRDNCFLFCSSGL
jgi:hypothetical protein